ncbi:NF-kappa-B-repressing factor-like [Lingula anatina]|uniref:NF-kappa-B-repressing factor-like n=1 Tax=Lingula anatina TaxID=7574 RepID=A0A1S3JJ66_LINAN|nr:NF-kappa-B-repressing factor-like [Lingula anatina]|eukprot:XP_013410455.1 NF-kappa-B-repressing factor-like [Lingula anatina]
MGYAENLVKAHAKQKACFEALEYLYKNNWTIMIKSTNPNDLCVLRRSDVLNWVPTMPQSVPADGARSGSSAAMNMMAKMGWTGGGLGSSENKGLPSAIEVAPSNTFSKRGVGNTIYDRVSSDLISKLEELLEFYAQCNTIDEIVFPGIEFSAEEKKAVIQIGQKYGLKTCGTEYNKMNYVLVGRKFTGSDLVKFLELHGNCSNKYMLVKPDTFQVEMNIP